MSYLRKPTNKMASRSFSMGSVGRDVEEPPETAWMANRGRHTVALVLCFVRRQVASS